MTTRFRIDFNKETPKTNIMPRRVTRLLFLPFLLLSIVAIFQDLRISLKYMGDSTSNGDETEPQPATSARDDDDNNNNQRSNTRAMSSLDTTIESSLPVNKTEFNSTSEPTVAPTTEGSTEDSSEYSSEYSSEDSKVASTTGADEPNPQPTMAPTRIENISTNISISNETISINLSITNTNQTPTQQPTYFIPPQSNATNLSISLPSPQWLEDIDTYKDILGCGGFKCAFRSITGDHGYLVAIKTEEEIQKAHTAIDLAEYLAATYGIRHTVLARPITTDKRMKRKIPRNKIPDHKNRLTHLVLANRLGRVKNRKIMNRGRRKAQRKVERAEKGEVLIMPIRLYPTQSVLFKCKDWEVREAFHKAWKLQPNNETDPKVFEKTLRSDLNLTFRMMESPEAACLSKDFQLVIDATTGGITHIDIDRCFDTRMRLYWDEQCQQKLLSLTQFIIDRLTYGDNGPNFSYGHKPLRLEDGSTIDDVIDETKPGPNATKKFGLKYTKKKGSKKDKSAKSEKQSTKDEAAEVEKTAKEDTAQANTTSEAEKKAKEEGTEEAKAS